MPAGFPIPTLDSLYGLFADNADQPAVFPLNAAELPEPYRRLLVHQLHMTVTVEQFYGEPVEVRVLDVVQRGSCYARKILLHLRHAGTVVQFGIVEIQLDLLTSEVSREITGGRTPLGRVLIQHDVLRTVHPIGFFRAELSPKLGEWFAAATPAPTYGRIGVITAAGRPAIRVAEILAPIPSQRPGPEYAAPLGTPAVPPFTCN